MCAAVGAQDQDRRSFIANRQTGCLKGRSHSQAVEDTDTAVLYAIGARDPEQSAPSTKMRQHVPQANLCLVCKGGHGLLPAIFNRTGHLP